MSVDDPEQLGRLFAERATAGDLEGLLALYEHSATFVGADGENVTGRDAIRGHLAGLLAMKPEIASTSSRVVLSGDLALMSGRWRMTVGMGDGGAGVEGESTEVARRQPNGSWLYAIDNPTVAVSEDSVRRVVPGRSRGDLWTDTHAGAR